jgi:hypothetical protein
MFLHSHTPLKHICEICKVCLETLNIRQLSSAHTSMKTKSFAFIRIKDKNVFVFWIDAEGLNATITTKNSRPSQQIGRRTVIS